MTLAPQPIVTLHRALLAALQVDYFPPGLGDVNAWQSFLFVLKPLEDSAGGPFTAADIPGAVRLMREQNRQGAAKWSLRFGKIMNEPEAFRDLVLTARRTVLPRLPVEKKSSTIGDITFEVERDPAAEHVPQPIADELQKLRVFRQSLKSPRP